MSCDLRQVGRPSDAPTPTVASILWDAPLSLEGAMSSSGTLAPYTVYADAVQMMRQHAATTKAYDDLDRRAMLAVYTHILPYAHQEAPVHLAMVASAATLDKVARALLCLHNAPVSAWPFNAGTDGPLPVGVLLRFFVQQSHPNTGSPAAWRVQALKNDASSLMSWRSDHDGSSMPAPSSPLSLPVDALSLTSSSSMLAPAPALAISTGLGLGALPESAAPRAELSRPPSAASNARWLRPDKSFISFPSLHRDGGARTSSGGAPSRHMTLYDMSTMVRSIEKWAPTTELPAAAEKPENAAAALAPRAGETASSTPSLKASSLRTAAPPLSYRGDTLSSPASFVSLPFKSGGSGTYGLPVPGASPVATAPSTLSNVSAFAHSLWGHRPGTVPLHVGSPAPNAAPSDTWQPSALWQAINVRVLPLFLSAWDGPPLEALTETTETYVRRLYERDRDDAMAAMMVDLQSLVSTGLASITLQLQQSDGLDLLHELLRTWTHYYGTTMPYLQAALGPLETLAQQFSRAPVTTISSQAPLSDTDSMQSDTSPAVSTDAASLALSSKSVALPSDSPTHSATSCTPPEPQGLPRLGEPSWLTLRAYLLQAFRDCVVLPMWDWLYTVSVRFDEVEVAVSRSALRARYTQLLHVLGSLPTDDAAQDRVEGLSKALRAPASPLAYGTSLPSSWRPAPSVSPLPGCWTPSSGSPTRTRPAY